MQCCDRTWDFQVKNWLVSLTINIPQEKGTVTTSRVFVFYECKDQWIRASGFVKGALYLRCSAHAEEQRRKLPTQAELGFVRCDLWLFILVAIWVINFFPLTVYTTICFAKFLIMKRTGFENWNASSSVCECAWKEIKERKGVL